MTANQAPQNALSAGTMYAVAPHFSGRPRRGQDAIIAAVGPALDVTLARYGINAPLRAAHFLAQTCHESAGFRTTEEFASGSAYEGRSDLGNTQPGDGRRYKGRGLIQLTGRFNYRRFGDRMGLPLEDEPERAAEPVLSLAIACEYWTDRKLNTKADRDDLNGITKAINGGFNGLEDRAVRLVRAKAVLGIDASVAAAATQAVAAPLLRRGDTGTSVRRLQRALVAAGERIITDAIFGRLTEAALKRVQARLRIERDGIAGPQTWGALAEEGTLDV
ncbi:MAG: peptidoglycan-binding protein [Pseudomonadota bacterium]